METMTDESNLLKLVSDLGSKIEAAKGKILAGEQEGKKCKSILLEGKISNNKQVVLCLNW